MLKMWTNFVKWSWRSIDHLHIPFWNVFKIMSTKTLFNFLGIWKIQCTDNWKYLFNGAAVNENIRWHHQFKFDFALPSFWGHHLFHQYGKYKMILLPFFWDFRQIKTSKAWTLQLRREIWETCILTVWYYHYIFFVYSLFLQFFIFPILSHPLHTQSDVSSLSKISKKTTFIILNPLFSKNYCNLIFLLKDICYLQINVMGMEGLECDTLYVKTKLKNSLHKFWPYSNRYTLCVK